MANSSELNILLSAQLNKTVGADLQKELDKLSQSLKLNLNATVKGLEGVSSSTGGTTQATQKATQALTVYEKAINNIIHSYKLKQTTDDQFVQSMNKAIQMQNFQTLSWQKQEQIIGLVSKAEQSYTKVRNEGIKNNSAIEKQNEDIKRKELEALHSEALEINKVFDLKRKQSEQTLQYEQKVRKAIEETNLKEQQTTKQLEEQIILFQKRMALESQRITGKYGSLVDSSSLNSLMNDINSLSPATENVTNKMKDFSLGMKEVELGAKNNSKAFKGAQQDSISWGAELARSAKKFSEWYLSRRYYLSIRTYQVGVILCYRA
jgi:flagellar hook-basal body complex protein FliE